MSADRLFIGDVMLRRPSADRQNLRRAQVRRDNVCRFAGAAGSQHKDFSSFDFNAGLLDERLHAVVIGIVAIQSAIPIDNGVYRANPPCYIAHFIQIGDDRLLVGNRHVDRSEILLFKEGADLFLAEFNQIICIIGKARMDLPGKAVRQLLTNTAVWFHQSFIPDQAVYLSQSVPNLIASASHITIAAAASCTALAR